MCIRDRYSILITSRICPVAKPAKPCSTQWYTILSYGCCMTPNLLVDTSKGQVVTSSRKHLADISLIQYRLPKGVSCCHYQVIRSFTEKLMAMETSSWRNVQLWTSQNSNGVSQGGTGHRPEPWQRIFFLFLSPGTGGLTIIPSGWSIGRSAKYSILYKFVLAKVLHKISSISALEWAMLVEQMH